MKYSIFYKHKAYKHTEAQLISILKLRCLENKHIFQPQNFFDRFHFFPNQV